MFRYRVLVPTNADARVHVPKLDLSKVLIMESGVPVWKGGSFIPGAVPGIHSAQELNGSIVFETGSGSFDFALEGQPGTTVCATAHEGELLNVQCPREERISAVRMASFGEFLGNITCLESPRLARDHAGSSRFHIQRLCLGHTHCMVPVSSELFSGDHSNVRGNRRAKQLLVHVTCSQ